MYITPLNGFLLSFLDSEAMILPFIFLIKLVYEFLHFT